MKEAQAVHCTVLKHPGHLRKLEKCRMLSIMLIILEISVGIQGKARVSFFGLEYSASPLEVVHLFRLENSDRYSLFHFRQTGSLLSLGKFRKEIK